MTLLTLQEANDQSYDQGRYPDFFPVNIGDDFKLESRPELFVTIPSPRKVKIEITSYRGCCCEAIHYYAAIIADGTKRLVTTAGYMGEEFNNLPREKRDIWDGNYHIEVARPVTEADIAKDPRRWEGYGPGDNTNAFNTAEEAEETARAIVSARFGDGWELEINNPYKK